MPFKPWRIAWVVVLFVLGPASVFTAADAKPADVPAAKKIADPDSLLRAVVNRLMNLAEPPADAAPQSVSAKLVVTKADGLPKEAAGATLAFDYQFPDKGRATVKIAGEEHSVGRDGQQVWLHQPAKGNTILAKAGVPRFAAEPNVLDDTVLPPFQLPYSRLKVRLTMLMLNAEDGGNEKIGGDDCRVLVVTPKAASLLGAEGIVAKIWVRQTDLTPMRVTATDGKKLDVQIDTVEATVGPPLAAGAYALKAPADAKVKTVALAHVAKFMVVGPKLQEADLPPLPPAKGHVKVVARCGEGRLELHDGARVLFLKGTAAEMGKQHGELLKDEVRDVCDRVLYGVGVGSSIVKGNWFFGEVEDAAGRLAKFTDPRVLAEADALADAAGVHRQEARLANFFPELFHCSGFALTGKATADGHVYHGRVLDYMRGVGLEANAVTIVYQPTDGRHAWVNVGYAGFVGSVTAMNEKGISVGEMGGRGYGQWDGKPMAQLVREVMEKAGTLDEAVAIMKAGPRTCEYYYVIADGKSKKAVGIGATPTTFEVVNLGEAHPKLPAAVEGTVLLSAGDRYTALVDRVKGGWGKFEAESARNLMTKPVCMNSNIQSVLFVPDTLDFYVSNADEKNVASHARYTKYNLGALLKGEKGKAAGAK